MGILLLFLLFVIMPISIGVFFLRLNIAMKSGGGRNIIIKDMLNKNRELDCEDEPALGIAYVLGLFSIFGIYQFAYLPFVVTTQEFMPTVYVYFAILISLSLFSLVINCKYIVKMIIHFVKRIKAFPFITWVVFALIAYQVFYVAYYEHVYYDDIYYFNQATEALASNTMFVYDPRTGIPIINFPVRYAFSGFNLCVAAMSVFLGLHPMIIFCTIIPIVFIPATYIVYSMIADKLFSKDRQKTGLFLFFLAILNLFGFYSTYFSTSVFLLDRIWEGKGLLGVIVIPLLFWYMIKISKRQENLSDWAGIFCVNFCACSFTSMSVYLTLVFLWAFAFVFTILQKSTRLIIPTIICTLVNFLTFIAYIIF